MALSVRYTNIDGTTVKENRGGTKRGYVPDPLGSTKALVDSSGAITDTWEYWPYGEVESHTGPSTTPFTFVGTLGYYKDAGALTYIRARYYQALIGQWMTVDPLWPMQSSFLYSNGAPNLHIDPTGAWCINMRGCTKADQKAIIAGLSGFGKDNIDRVTDCMQGCAPSPAPGCLKDHFNATCDNGQIQTFTVRCDYNCTSKIQCGIGAGNDNQGKPMFNICIPPPPDCKNIACTIIHELMHVCGVLGIPNYRDAFECVRQLPGCGTHPIGH